MRYEIDHIDGKTYVGPVDNMEVTPMGMLRFNKGLGADIDICFLLSDSKRILVVDEPFVPDLAAKALEGCTEVAAALDGAIKNIRQLITELQDTSLPKAKS